MEIFRSAGIEEAIRREEPPFPWESGIMFVESLAGQAFENLMEDMNAYFTDASPVEGNSIAQAIPGTIFLRQMELRPQGLSSCGRTGTSDGENRLPGKIMMKWNRC